MTQDGQPRTILALIFQYEEHRNGAVVAAPVWRAFELHLRSRTVYRLDAAVVRLIAQASTFS